ncbi:similar to Saccharomyces cerevisiae YGL047W ALG13 Catalytic component of UDP-GlcNAc transferase, required for the second step of dolichyl- linked oligosaccharide synthesis [Maudiozyma barnettii]|uniref:UDP-N-acetylglucosamine transferase subunit ALG13 n=1 Tax=Maudiozyma barnettii TaxID=61262 RepID=A0A8H2VD89_9SACH|nr:N-acetylglucosaminyldiphosphodolichol N-acetylglucosaminyltransferase catalytic subunit ALG13 [Kazachstania barnettii]CAB4253077.1 similar to Saccharomyces cerevisiae YGL047W ALG13 Catalytic component of UDP-GlcNAc transferase, required for the second step of dolichyl- linked oligosaccharide synthesis [Kazachstania barnettii]CAD1780388.1 similar to Saccharomyces cerevisiae YGL047W ALG13 Catalytic component of UDP-GlcNAc transferase, required for the second step of dolichyl- linked oligosacchar
MKTIFVTCGATVPFPDLINSILSKNFIDCAVENGFTRIIAQIGNGYTETLVNQVAKLSMADDYMCHVMADELGCNSIASSFKFESNGLEFIAIEYSSKIEDLITIHGDLVISHGGTGSILDSLRLRKPLIVCVNDNLMDNHQQQIADKFENSGYIVSCTATPSSLTKSLTTIQGTTLKQFPTAHNVIFEQKLVDIAFSF